MINKDHIKSLGFDADTVWYHGTKEDFDAFRIPNTPKNGDEHGSGIYFTKYPDIASGYAIDDHNKPIDGAKVIPVHLKLKKQLKKPLTRTQISKLITSSPHLHDSLTNYGDVNYEGHHKVLNRAIDTYTDFDDPVRQIGTIRNDFYNNADTSHFLQKLSKHTGVDHHYFTLNGDPKGGVVVYKPENIRSIHAKFDPEKINSTNISESFKDVLIKTLQKYVD